MVKNVSGRDDESILQVAREHEIDIPTLCYLDGLSGWGGCRLCLVHIEGNNKLLPACVTMSLREWLFRQSRSGLTNIGA